MAEHNVFLGGLSTGGRGFYEMLPSTEQSPDGVMYPTSHKSNGRHSVTRHLFWSDDHGGPSDGISRGSRALADYLSNHEVAEGAVLPIAIIPRRSSLIKVWVEITKPLAGFEFTLRVRGNAASVGGVPGTPATFTIAENIDGGEEGTDGNPVSRVYPVAIPGDPGDPGADPPVPDGDPTPEPYFDQNDMIQLVIESLPPEGIGCSGIKISPVFETYEEGAY